MTLGLFGTPETVFTFSDVYKPTEQTVTVCLKLETPVCRKEKGVYFYISVQKAQVWTDHHSGSGRKQRHIMNAGHLFRRRTVLEVFCLLWLRDDE